MVFKLKLWKLILNMKNCKVMYNIIDNVGIKEHHWEINHKQQQVVGHKRSPQAKERQFLGLLL